jgi:HAE1 family hydrophobic/amphiphilic exporter-1
VAATTFAIVAVFVPVAFMGQGPGQWFKPFALTVVASVIVSLLISFTLDPMLSAYWGTPRIPPRREARHQQAAAALQRLVRPCGRCLRPRIAWALHHRRWMA